MGTGLRTTDSSRSAAVARVFCGLLAATILIPATPATGATRGPATPFSDPAAAESAVLLGEGPISSPGFETSGTVTPDGKTFYFTLGGPDFGQFFFTVVSSSFSNGRWSNPEIASFSGEYADTSPFLSPDGQMLVFASNRPVDGVAKSASDFDLWAVDRQGAGWSEPRHLSAINGSGWDMHSSMAKDGTIYFGSIRNDNYDIWKAARVDGAFGAPQQLGAPVNGRGVEYDPYIDPDQRYLIFGSDERKDSLGGVDLYVSFLSDGQWSEPINLGPKVNTPRREAGGFVVRAGGKSFLVFNSESGRRLDRPIRPKERLTTQRLRGILTSVDNQSRNFYYIELRALGIPGLD